MEDAARARWALIGWVASLAGAIALFTWLGGGALQAPALTRPASWGAWVAATPAEQVAFTLARLLVLALAWYLVGVTTLGALARWARWLRLVRVADALAVPSVRRLLQASLGVGLATASVASITVPVAPRAPIAAGPGVVAAGTAATGVRTEAPVESDVDAPLDDGAVVRDPLWHLVQELGGTPPAHGTAHVEVEPTDVAGSPTTATDAEVERPLAGRDGEGVATLEQRTWEVRPGDHLWGIAEEVVAAHLGRVASDAEVDPYWRRLIAANREALVNPADPDLILPGQRFALPALGV